MPGTADFNDDDDEPDRVEEHIIELERRWGIRDEQGNEREITIEQINALLPIHLDTAADVDTTDPLQYNTNPGFLSTMLGAPGTFRPVHVDLFESRKRRFDELYETNSKVRHELQRLQGIQRNEAPDMAEEIRHRLNRLIEFLYYAEQMQQCFRHLRTITQPGSTPGVVEGPEVHCQKKFRAPDEETMLPYQDLLYSMLKKLELCSYRRLRTGCYEAVYVNGMYTYAWKQVSTIREFVWSSISRDANFTNWKNATSSRGNITSVVEYLEQCKDREFPVMVRNRRMIAFRNALLITAVWDAENAKWKSLLVRHDRPRTPEMNRVINEITADGSVAFVYHNIDMPDFDAQDLPPTPALDKIIDYQEWPDEVNFWMYAFIGRMLHPISGPNAIEKSWQVAPVFLGLGNTGKSTLISDVIALFFESSDIAYIQNNVEKQFGLSTCEGKAMWLAPEVKSDFSCEQAQWQQAVAGEKLSTAKKHCDPVKFDPFDLPGCFAGNETIGFSDNGDSVSRRMVTFWFGKSVKNNDPDLTRNLKLQLPAIIYRCNEMYLQAANMMKSRIWNYLPKYFCELRQETSQNTNTLAHFLAHGAIRYDKDAYVLVSDFVKVYRHHCKANDLVAKQLRKEYTIGPFSARGLVQVESIVGSKRRGPFIIGCDLSPVPLDAPEAPPPAAASSS